MLGDQLAWWGESLQKRGSRMQDEAIGATGYESDADYLRKLIAHLG
jgi:hypothetical protein